MSKKRTKKSGKTGAQSGKKQLYKHLISKLFESNPGKQFTFKDLVIQLGAKTAADRRLIDDTLKEINSQKRPEQPKTGKRPTALEASGTLDFTKQGAAYLVTPDGEQDVFIPVGRTGKALQGDEVVIRINQLKRGKPEGEVIRVEKRAQTTFVCHLHVNKNIAFGVPVSARIHVDFFLDLQHLKKAKPGQKILVDMTDWPEDAKNPFGKVSRVLGDPGDNEAEMNAIVAEYGFPLEFPPKVLKAADQIDVSISQKEIAARRDFRNVLTFTIDPFDAKDFDDALSLEILPNGNLSIGVHIADVSHYLTPNSDLDKEAYLRATSIYLVDRTIPMLPEVLSNQVCSLRPNEEKLTYSAVFELTPQAKLVNEWFGRTIINSNHRFTYEEAQAIIEGAEHPHAEAVKTLDKLAKIMRRERMAKGAIEFGGSEVKFHLDEKGRPLGVYEKELKDSNKLIEEFMLLANKRVAERVGKKEELKGKAFVYRIHDSPDPEKLKLLRDFVKRLGYKLNSIDEEEAAGAINKLLKDVENSPEEEVVKQMAIRAMAKAIYSTENIGHYGLGFEYYTHFTSPIRRYPDVLVHRLLTRYLENGKSAVQKDLEGQCKHCSTMEKKASEAERASIKYKQVEFLQNKIGDEFSGMISGLARWGFYVELKDNRCEGLVPLNSLTDDAYFFDEQRFVISGMRRKRTFNFGDEVKIQVYAADLINKTLEFRLVKNT